MTLMKINGVEYQVNDDEFLKIPHDRYGNLIIRDDVGKFERIASLINEISRVGLENLIVYNTTHGGFLPINCAQNYRSVFAIETHMNNVENIVHNASNFKKNNIHFKKYLHNIQLTDFTGSNANSVFIFSENDTCLDMDFIQENKPVLLTAYNDFLARSGLYTNVFRLTGSKLVLYVPDRFSQEFITEFSYFINDSGELDYDNLNHLCIMVKNGGPQFEKMLLDNMAFFDRWTILDTGSTDDTIDIIHRVLVGKKKGALYQEPFINFKESRNRCLDLAGDSCKFITMLDDTYVVNGNLRGFLNEVRGDQMSTSFTLYIQSDDTVYGSNRIIKT